MAQIKKSLDYYSHPIGMTADRRLIPARRRFGSAVVDVLFAVLDMIYGGTGYYMAYDDSNRDEVLWDIAGRIRGKDSPDEDAVEEIIGLLVTGGIFDKELFERGILTSKQVQEQFFLSTLKRKSVTVETDFWLLSVEYLETLSEKSAILDVLRGDCVRNNDSDVKNIVSDGNNDDPDVGNSQSKGKESKEKKTKEKESKSEAAAPASQETLPDTHSQLTDGEDFSSDSFSDKDDIKRLTDEQIKQLIIREHGEETMRSYEQRFRDWSRTRNVTKNVRMYPMIYRWIKDDIPQKQQTSAWDGSKTEFSYSTINVDEVMNNIMAKYRN